MRARCGDSMAGGRDVRAQLLAVAVAMVAVMAVMEVWWSRWSGNEQTSRKKQVDQKGVAKSIEVYQHVVEGGRAGIIVAKNKPRCWPVGSQIAE